MGLAIPAKTIPVARKTAVLPSALPALIQTAQQQTMFAIQNAMPRERNAVFFEAAATTRTGAQLFALTQHPQCSAAVQFRRIAKAANSVPAEAATHVQMFAMEYARAAHAMALIQIVM